MSPFFAYGKDASIRARSSQYGIAIVSVTAAYSIVFILRSFHVRDPFASIFLAAIEVRVWYGGPRPGALAIGLSTLVLLMH
jgi:hypothetical protein